MSIYECLSVLIKCEAVVHQNLCLFSVKIYYVLILYWNRPYYTSCRYFQLFHDVLSISIEFVINTAPWIQTSKQASPLSKSLALLQLSKLAVSNYGSQPVSGSWKDQSAFQKYIINFIYFKSTARILCYSFKWKHWEKHR